MSAAIVPGLVPCKDCGHLIQDHIEIPGDDENMTCPQCPNGTCSPTEAP